MENRNANLVAGCGIILIIVICIGSGLLLNPPQKATVSPVVIQTNTPTITPTETPVPTSTSEPTTTALPEPTETPLPTGTREPTSTARANSAAGTPTLYAAFELRTFSSKVELNSQAYATIRTVPGASCKLTYTNPAGNVVKSKDLVEKVADSHGFCYWTWKVSYKTEIGKASITIVANNFTQTYTMEIVSK